jgi:demethoxyubiquinone hydroxylase (CLK1/Coq7/Cat5 family)
MLEHMGSHKIMATQHRRGIEQPTLKHIAEEAHHAYFMKRQAEKMAGRPLEYIASELLAPASARMYFQRLEAVMLRRLEAEQSASATYLYMSMIVEFRALWLYRLYQHMLRRARHPLSLKRIIGEEQGHLADMAQRLESADELSDVRAAAFVDLETRLFKRLLAAMARDAGALAAA